MTARSLRRRTVRETSRAGLSRGLVSALAVLLLTVTPFSLMDAQARVSIIRDRTVCRDCRIRANPFALLGDSSGSGGELHGNTRGVVVDSLGNVFVSSFGWGELITHFDVQGRFKGHIGQRGAGPGEYRNAWAVSVVSDSLFVADAVNARLTVHSIATNRELRVVSMPWFARANSMVRLADGSLIGNVVIETPEAAGMPLHHFDPMGTKLRSFGSTVPELRPDLRLATVRSLALAREGGVWVAHLSKYEVERYGSDGKIRQVIRREADWFPPGSGRMVTPQPDGAAPLPKVMGVFEVTPGRLWVISVVPDSNWRTAFSRERLAPRRQGELGYFDIEDSNRLYDTVIEIFDTRRGVLIATGRLDAALAGFVSPSVAWSGLGDGSPGSRAQVRLWKLTFDEP